MSPRLLWYIPNQARPGHRGDDVVAGHNSLETLTAQATALEEHGWDGALLGTGSTVQPRPAARRARRHPPLEFGLRVTTVVRDTAGEAWADAEDRVAAMARGRIARDMNWNAAAGQRRLLDLAARGEVLDRNLYTAPGRYGGAGAATTWLVGSAADVAASLRDYQALGVTHFILSDTPYLPELVRQGDRLLPLLRHDSRQKA
ncbi:LLM class flavin-dependent oxidoreductase [Nonomuraea wenchangensis]|uniref:Alkanesulfonate monooxygenase n=1 Tax=Nonomuraea wenchangensis TaxID=568860 RepID=A0A1I0L5D0_9ACTN|nr:LLM class flavin-dependent oxidoreductase [Nonomuraea wenchangensis]SEU34922.1 alkanesulfonate monooxygenase [Nonomuraea wenchangensis]